MIGLLHMENYKEHCLFEDNFQFFSSTIQLYPKFFAALSQICAHSSFQIRIRIIFSSWDLYVLYSFEVNKKGFKLIYRFSRVPLPIGKCSSMPRQDFLGYIDLFIQFILFMPYSTIICVCYALNIDWKLSKLNTSTIELIYKTFFSRINFRYFIPAFIDLHKNIFYFIEQKKNQNQIQ